MLNLTVNIRNSNEYTIDLQKRDSTHYFYTGEMMRIIKENDRTKCDEMLRHTLHVMKVIDLAKKSAGIVFAADEE